MEFEDEHDEEQEEEDDEEEITIPPPAAPPSYDSVGGNSGAPTRGRVNPERRSGVTRYRECLKNHAVSIGGHAVDGCGEFMAAGEEGTLDALKCAACNCHRNFHRKETDPGGDPSAPSSTTAAPHPPPPPPSGGGALYPQFSAYYRTPAPPSGYLHVSGSGSGSGPHHHLHHHHHHNQQQQVIQQQQQRPLAALPSTSGGTHSGELMDDMSHPSSSGGGGGGGMNMMMRESGSGGSKKRFRTKFTQEQKDKMLAFAEKLGWRIQKHDEAAVQQFCAEVQVKRQVLKVWMHNNKHTLGKKP